MLLLPLQLLLLLLFLLALLFQVLLTSKLLLFCRRRVGNVVGSCCAGVVGGSITGSHDRETAAGERWWWSAASSQGARTAAKPPQTAASRRKPSKRLHSVQFCLFRVDQCLRPASSAQCSLSIGFACEETVSRQWPLSLRELFKLHIRTLSILETENLIIGYYYRADGLMFRMSKFPFWGDGM